MRIENCPLGLAAENRNWGPRQKQFQKNVQTEAKWGQVRKNGTRGNEDGPHRQYGSSVEKESREIRWPLERDVRLRE